MLNESQQKNLVDVVDYEIKNHLCFDAPKYQTFNNMQFKYQSMNEMNILLNSIKLQSYIITNKKFKISACWFNIIKKDSPFEISYHTHNSSLICVYYLKNCTNNGTFILINDQEIQLSCLDNTIQFMRGDILHSVPKFNGFDRYSIAFDLNEEK